MEQAISYAEWVNVFAQELRTLGFEGKIPDILYSETNEMTSDPKEQAKLYFEQSREVENGINFEDWYELFLTQCTLLGYKGRIDKYHFTDDYKAGLDTGTCARAFVGEENGK